MITVKIILTAILTSFYFIDMGRFPVKWKINVKPFNCHMCLSFYLAVIYFWLPSFVDSTLFVAFASGVAAPLFRNFLNNIFFKK